MPTKIRHNFNLWPDTVLKLKQIIKLQPVGKEESQVALLDRLVQQELERVSRQNKEGEK